MHIVCTRKDNIMSSRVKKNSRGLFGTKNCKQRNKKKNTGTRYERNSKIVDWIIVENVGSGVWNIGMET